MTRNHKIIIGILTFIPFIGVIFYFIFFISMFLGFTGLMGQEEQPEFIFDYFSKYLPFLIAFGLSSLIGFGLFIFFLICAIRDVSATENDKLLWILLIIFVSYFAFPFYWYFRIWKNPEFSLNNAVKTDYTN
jgi:flagellar basal body-associated protein FliL